MERIVRRTRHAVALRDVLTLVIVRWWLTLAVFAGVLFALWYRPRAAPKRDRRGANAR